MSSVRIVRILPAPPEAVFDAWLDPEAIRVWMCPGDIFESVAEVEPRVGGRFRIVMRSPGRDDPHTGVYLEIDRPRRLVFTWSSAGTSHRDTVVTLELRPHGESGCELTLVHSDLPPDAVEPHTIGWKAHVRVLIGYLESRGLSRAAGGGDSAGSRRPRAGARARGA